MAHYRNYNNGGYGEREPLGDYHDHSPSRPQRHQSPYQDQDPYHHQQSYQEYAPQGYQYEEPQYQHHQQQPPPPQYSGGHPEASFNRLRSERSQGRGGRDNYYPPAAAVGAAGAGMGYGAQHPPQPPSHANNSWGVTPGADNFSETASGGMAGIAYSVADQNARQSGVEAMRDVPRAQDHGHYDSPSMPQQAYYNQSPRPSANGMDRDSHSSLTPLGGAAIPPGTGTPTRSPLGYGAHNPYNDDPYQSYSASRSHDAHLGVVNPNMIIDDGDDGLVYHKPQRSSMLSLSHSDRGSSTNATSVAAGAAAVGGAAAAAGAGSRGSGYYAPVKNQSAFDLGSTGGEKPSEWMKSQESGKKKWKWIVIIGVIVIIIGAIIGGTLGAILGNKGGSGSSSGGSRGGGGSAADDTKANGDLNINSAEIKELMNNDNLHKVFPGFDYTPLNAQYPYCMHNPPSQNNITRDIAVLSKLTNIVRLYGSDCNQTEMVIHAIQQLELQNTMRIWISVWLDQNATTNKRQTDQLYDILDNYDDTYFEGVIVGNEVLFRKDMTVTQLAQEMNWVRGNLTEKKHNLPVATSDLGSAWTAELAASSDYLLSNIHPLFMGVDSSKSAGETWNFWENNNAQFFKSDNSKNVIAELGWPSSGGQACPYEVETCQDPAVANIRGINDLLDGWVCDAIKNGTQYWWFSAFDEPWKAQFDTADRKFESAWGLMDVNRNLKDGVKIPDCNGAEVPKLTR